MYCLIQNSYRSMFFFYSDCKALLPKQHHCYRKVVDALHAYLMNDFRSGGKAK